MLPIPSSIEGKSYQLYKLEKELQQQGFSIGSNWEYDHGYFDYKIASDSGYQFLRIPFKAVDGQLDSQGITVEIGRPFLLAHQFQAGLDDDVNIDLSGLASTFNQFSKPIDTDAQIPKKYIEFGKSLVKKLEALLEE